jgi:hypothetical protein
LVKKRKGLGYDLYSRDEFNTSQMFPELGERVIETGNDKMKKYCPSKVHILRYYGSREHGRYFSLRNQWII